MQRCLETIKLRDRKLYDSLLGKSGLHEETDDNLYTSDHIQKLIKASEEIQAEDISSLKDMYGKLGIEKYKPTPQAPASTVKSGEEKAVAGSGGQGVLGGEQKRVFVHETDASDFEKFDVGKIGSGQGEAWLGKGVYLQEKGAFKFESYGKNKIEATLKPDAKIFEIKDTPDGKYRNDFVEWAVENTEIGKRKAEERIKDGLSLDNLLPRDILKGSTEAVDKLKEQGYDGLIQDGELVIYNPDVLEVKQKPQTTPSKLPKGEGQAELPIGGETKNIINETIQEGDSREVTHGVIGRVGKFVSRVFGGKPSEKVFVAKDEKSLINKANEFQKEGGDVKYMFKEAVIGAVAMLQPMKISESKGVRTEQTTKFQSKDERAVIDILNNYYKENNETPPQEVIDRTLYLWDKFGRPEISGDSTKKDERAFATYEGGKVKIGNITNFDDFIAELSHSAQYVSGKKMDNREYATEALRDSIEYKRKGSMENKAHTLIEPILARYIFNGDSAELNKIQYQKKDGNILGFTHNGKIYLNGENLNPETPIHEAGHIWTEWAKQNDSKLYNKGIELINGSKYLKSIKEDSFYQIEANRLSENEREQYLQHEALAQAIGDKGAQFVSESKKAGFKEWLNNLWSNIKNAAGFKDLSNKEFQNLTLDEFSKRAAKDILDEKPTIQEGTEGTKSQPSKESSEPKKLATEASQGAEPQKAVIHVQYPPTSLNYMGTGKLETEFGIEEREPTQRKRDIYTIKEADELIDKGWDIQKELNKVYSGEKTFVSDAEYINFTRYAAELSDRLRGIKDVKSPQYDKTLRELNRVANAANLVGKETARALGIRSRFSTVAEGSYGEFMLNEMAANKDAPLTEKQKETANAEFEKLDAVRKKLDEDTKAFEEKISAFRAEQELAKTKKAASKSKKRTHEDLVKEREDIFKNIGEKWKDAGKDVLSSDFPYRKQIAAIAPDVLKLARNLVEDGVLKLEDVVKNIHERIKGGAPELQEKDIHNILAGEYNEKKITKRDAAIAMENLRIEAQLLNKYERLVRGEEPKNEKAKTKRTQEIEDLRKKINEFIKEESQFEKFYPDIKDATFKKLETLQKRNESETKKVKEKITKGDFAPDVKKTPLMEDREIQKKFPEQFKATQKSLDEFIKVKREIALRRLKQMYENKSSEEKIIDIFSKSLNVPRTLMASFDFSAPLRQAIIATAAHPQIASKALKFMFEAAKDERVYNRWLEDVHNDSRWHIAEKTGLGITDPESLHIRDTEEAFQGAPYAEKIPVVGLGVKASERAYIGFLNKMRWDLFNMYADKFEDTGKAYENNPKLYEGISSFINSATGRGGMKGLENASPVLNWFLFASKLIASRLNMLGLSDIPNLAIRGATFGKYGIDYGFYTRLPKEMRIEAAKDMAKFVAVGMTILLIAGAAGADVEDDPRSSDFGKIKVGNSRWDIWGGFQPYARVLTQMITGQRKTTTTGQIQELDGKGFMGQNRFTPLGSFARGKLAPIPATVIDLATRKDAAGQPVTVPGELLSLVTPLMLRDTYEAMQDQGVKALFTVGIPAAFGIGVQTYEPRKPKQQTFKIYQKTGDKVRESTEADIEAAKKDAENIYKKQLEDAEKNKGWGYNKYGEMTIDDDEITTKKKKADYNKLSDEDKNELQDRLKKSSSDKSKTNIKY